MMYITASQPSKENRTTWLKRQETLSSGEDGVSMGSSISTYGGSMASLKDVTAAKEVLSIFDVSSNAIKIVVRIFIATPNFRRPC